MLCRMINFINVFLFLVLFAFLDVLYTLNK